MIKRSMVKQDELSWSEKLILTATLDEYVCVYLLIRNIR